VGLTAALIGANVKLKRFNVLKGLTFNSVN